MTFFSYIKDGMTHLSLELFFSNFEKYFFFSVLNILIVICNYNIFFKYSINNLHTIVIYNNKIIAHTNIYVIKFLHASNLFKFSLMNYNKRLFHYVIQLRLWRQHRQLTKINQQSELRFPAYSFILFLQQLYVYFLFYKLFYFLKK